jgi:hypothetical protein
MGQSDNAAVNEEAFRQFCATVKRVAACCEGKGKEKIAEACGRTKEDVEKVTSGRYRNLDRETLLDILRATFFIGKLKVPQYFFYRRGIDSVKPEIRVLPTEQNTSTVVQAQL